MQQRRGKVRIRHLEARVQSPQRPAKAAAQAGEPAARARVPLGHVQRLARRLRARGRAQERRDVVRRALVLEQLGRESLRVHVPADALDVVAVRGGVPLVRDRREVVLVGVDEARAPDVVGLPAFDGHRRARLRGRVRQGTRASGESLLTPMSIFGFGMFGLAAIFFTRSPNSPK